ncbi:hypothetical protein [Streptomyces sp. NBC_01190]|uniref:hypothetical protein n=1 Tax=Streptomyces sp. NBC_01190 TaxID=2903767 RepID=UPI00386F6F81|nr:hypothetical protein OG519_31445 [Streptomyces sp. NBC_01190]
MEIRIITDGAATRLARFGKLPERVRHEDMVETQVAPNDPAKSAYDPEASWNHFNCLAMDLGL